MREIVSLNRKWFFSKTMGETVTATADKWDIVNLPHTWNAIDGQDGENDYYRGRCVYQKTIRKAELPQAERYYLEICGANASADVYSGGKKLAHHDGGYSTFRVNITDELQTECVLSIAVDNSASESVYPQMADFTFYGGLYRDVSLICVPESHFDLDYYGAPGIKVTPTVQGKDADVAVEVFLTDAHAAQTLHYTLLDAEENILAEKTAPVSDTAAVLHLDHVHLWHGRTDPYLYKAVVELKAGEEILDAVSAAFGCRTFEIDPRRGFILNGEEYPLRGVSRHQDRWGIGNALLPEHHEQDIDLICEVGATTVRLAHYQHDQYFYDLCDRKGLVVWAEIPYISNHMPAGRENTVSQMKELVLQNYNHPSIVVWGLSNEITMNGSGEDLLENHRLLNDMVHEMDPTRKTAVAVVSMCDIHDPYIQIPDVVSYNHYFGWYGGETSMNGPWLDKFHAEFPDIPIGVSEYGCEALDWHTSNPTQGDYTEEYQAYYHEELIKQLFTRKYIWATHVWNMFDFGADARAEGGENGQNHKGLVTFDRKYKKDAFYAYKAWLSDEPFVHICGKRYVDRVEDVTKVTVYSNLPEVELFVNGQSLGKQRSGEHFFYFEVPNKGTSTLVAKAGDCEDTAVLRKVEKFNDKYRLVEKGAVLNWFDIQETEGMLSLNSKMGDVLASAAGMQLFAGLFAKLGGKQAAGFEMNEGMMQMMGGFTVLRLLSMLGMMDIQFTKEELLALNEQLRKIPKP
ncbi:MAG: glycoside hydrolase family 2 TIM barrel-domain containing protein [Acutalibacteraceae bacterium]